MNASNPVALALRMELTPPKKRAYMSAITTSTRNLSWGFSTRLTGPLYDQEQYLLPFWFTLICYTSSTILFAIFFHNIESDATENNQKENQPGTSKRGGRKKLDDRPLPKSTKK